MPSSFKRTFSVLSMTAIAETRNRRAFVHTLLLAAISAGFPTAAFSQEAKPSKKTFTYKTVQRCAIKADVYQGVGSAPHPVVVWIHGGALIMGSRSGIDLALLDKLLKAGYVVVSIDYRLAPETKLPAILEDVQDACKWIREKGP